MYAPRVGEEFAGYRIEAVLGRGGMGVVYRAEHLVLERKVALKVLGESLAGDDDFRRRFTREYKLAASIDHPNIIPIYEAGEIDEVLYISMRYVEGADLKEHMRKESVLDAAFVTSVLEQAASALDAAHANGLVHRDVKPHNVLISDRSGRTGKHVYLSDFGLAKQIASRSDITATGTFMGTVDYVAPEQIEGRDLDARIDVYALGCVLFECLTGRVPFPGDTDVAVASAHISRPVPAVGELRQDLPAGLDRVVARALAKRPEDRYQTCGELMSAARTVLEGSGHDLHEPIGAGGRRATPPRGRDREDATAVIASTKPPLADPLQSVDPALAGGGAVQTVAPADSGPPAMMPVPPGPVAPWEGAAAMRPGGAKKRRVWAFAVGVVLVVAAATMALVALDQDGAQEQTDVDFVARASSRFPGQLAARLGDFRFQARDLPRVRAVGRFVDKLGAYYKNAADEQVFHFVVSFRSRQEAEDQRESHVEFLIATAGFEVIQEEPLRKALGTRVGTVTLLRNEGDNPQEAVIWSNETVAGGVRGGVGVALDFFSEVPY